MGIDQKHLDKDDVKKLLSDYRNEVQPFYDMVDAFNMMFGDMLYEQTLGIKRHTKIVLAPKLSFNLMAKTGFRNLIELNIGVLPLVKALVVNVAKLDFVCNEIPFDKHFDQEEVLDDIADVFNAAYYMIDSYDMNDEHISELLDETDLGARQELSYSLFKKTLYFLILHEHAHILCRHASHINKKNDFVEFQMSTEPSDVTPSFKKKKHWAELEADHFGADLLVEILRVFNFSPEKQEVRTLMEGEEKELRQIFLAIGLLFLLFSYRPDEETSIAIYRQYNHPHPCVRMVNVLDVLSNYISTMFSIDIESICNTLSEALSVLITIGNAVGVKEFEIIQTSLDDIQKEISDLQNNIGQSWIKRTGRILVKAIIAIRKDIPLV
jgi:hypothetical protein